MGKCFLRCIELRIHGAIVQIVNVIVQDKTIVKLL